MDLKILYESNFRVVAPLEGDVCSAEDFLSNGEKTTQASRNGMRIQLEMIAELGLQGVPSAWWHEADKEKGIYELVKGQLRLFFFKGEGKEIAVCTCGVMKKGQKADKPSVNKSATLKDAYYANPKQNTYEE